MSDPRMGRPQHRGGADQRKPHLWAGLPGTDEAIAHSAGGAVTDIRLADAGGPELADNGPAALGDRYVEADIFAGIVLWRLSDHPKRSFIRRDVPELQSMHGGIRQSGNLTRGQSALGVRPGDFRALRFGRNPVLEH